MGQEVSEDMARKRELALETLADKLRKGDIDRNLADKLKQLNLTKEDALKLVERNKLDKIKSANRGKDQAPGANLTTVKRKLDQAGDAGQDVPDELSSSYRTFTERRNQQPQPKR